MREIKLDLNKCQDIHINVLDNWTLVQLPILKLPIVLTQFLSKSQQHFGSYGQVDCKIYMKGKGIRIKQYCKVNLEGLFYSMLRLTIYLQ